MNTFVIQGLGGKRRLNGTVTINGAKNSALKAMAASILFDGPVTLQNVPNSDDIHTLTTILEKLGATVRSQKDGHELVIDSSKISNTDIDQDLAKNMRGSVVLTGPLLARCGKVTFPAPGGCVIGARPIDLFLKGYEKMGATVSEVDCVYDIKTEGGLEAPEITFQKISVGATETLMMAGVLAQGKTILRNCAQEPEIVNVAEWLNQCGAKIVGAGTATIEIQGTNGKLLSPKTPFVTIPDRIETGSFLILGALCARELRIEACEPKHISTLIDLLKESGISMDVGDNFILVHGDASEKVLKPVAQLVTKEYPGFATDLQAPFVTYLTQTTGESKVRETIFEGRFKYVEDLVRMGAQIKTIDPLNIQVTGPTMLKELPKGEYLTAHDIRAGFALVIAALIGEGTFTIKNIHLIDRGYEKLEERLKNIGADIRRM